MEQVNDEVRSEIPLPDELLSKIISQFIPLCEWSNCLDRVSKQFQRCVEIAYGRLKSIDYRKLFSFKKSLHMENKDEFFIRLNHTLEKLLAVCPNLVEIARSDNIQVCGRSITWDILLQFDRLESICLKSIKNIAFPSFANFVANSKSLKILNVSYCSFDSDGTLDIGSLSTVNLRYASAWSEPNVHLKMKNLSKKLTCLTLHSFEQAFENPVDAMKNCTNLESFSVNEFSRTDYELLLQTLPNLCKLTTLRVNGYLFKNGYHNVFDGRFYDHLQFLKNQLQCIEISEIDIDDQMQRFFLTECVQLHSLILNRISALSASVLKTIRHLPVQLKKLTFPFPRDKSDETLKFLMPNLVNLTNFTDLTIGWNGVATFYREALEDIAYLVNLEKLRIDYGIVDDILLEKWDNKNPEMFEKLVSFQLSFANISNRGAILVAKKAKNMKILDIRGSTISEETIFVLANVAKKLTSTNLDQETAYFDENAVIHLIKNVISLKLVKVHKQLVDKIRGNENFAPFAEIVEILDSYYGDYTDE